MPTESGKPLIVISYAHADEPEHPAEGEVKWLSFVTGYLRPAIKHGEVDLWLDRLISGGADWNLEIEQKIRACDIFILLVSRHSLSSDYVVDREIAIIRERQAASDNVHFYPLVLTPTPKIGLDRVRDKNLRPHDGKPLSDYSLHERYRHMSQAADEIAEITAQIAARKSVAATLPLPPTTCVRRGVDTNKQQPIETWLRGVSREVSVAVGERAALRVAALVERAAKSRIGTARAGLELSVLIGPIMRASAIARVFSKYVPHSGSIYTAAQFAADAAQGVADVVVFDAAAAQAANAAAHAARACAYAYADAAAPVRAALAASAELGAHAAKQVSLEIQADIEKFRLFGAKELGDLPLWSRGAPDWAVDAWSKVCTTLPSGEDWELWTEWYEERLQGGPRHEQYELIFATAPQEEWHKGPTAANAWIRVHLPERPDEQEPRAEAVVGDQESLEAWLVGRSQEVAVAIIARRALRIAPLAVSRLGEWQSQTLRIADLTSAICRGNAVGWVVAKYPAHAGELRPSATDARDAGYASTAAISAAAADAAATRDAAADARAAVAAAAATAAVAARDPRAAAGRDPARVAGVRVPSSAEDAACWAAVRMDIKEVQFRGAGAMLDLPLWPSGASDWARPAWADLKAALPIGQNWEVWIDWYEERLHGGSRGEDHELVFASVPREEWNKGPAAANGWIKAHLPKTQPTALPPDVPEAVPSVGAPFAYRWTASQHVAVAAGSQNLPDYRHFSSEEDHRRALEACRVGGERLLKALRDKRYNARREYAEALEYYLADLPRTAGVGNILLANDQVRILHAMFLADAAMLPEGLASRLKSVIANQFALNAFYDLVQRHNVAVSAGNWSQPFPLGAAKGFFGVVEDNTPRWFEPQVERGLRQVEQAEPPPPAAREPVPASVIEPPPLPPGTPDAQHSWKRQMATSANALWETFLQGRHMPVNQDEWSRAAAELSAHVRPIIEFLRAQEERPPTDSKDSAAFNIELQPERENREQ